ncbi:MAG: methyltransferase domain-containing protein [Acidobacteria bacterium]|nr:methyltransferase domain-containing protein [Acidobacteriota bacterium]
MTQQIYEIPSLAVWRAAELKVLRHMQFPEPILEIGCGSGLFSGLLFDRIECGIDLSEREVAACRARTGIYKVVRCMDARSLQFEDKIFSTVFANCVIEHIPGLETVLREAFRVLKPGGKFIATVPLDSIQEHLVLRTPAYGNWRAARLSHVNLLSQDGWLRAFRSAGFGRLKVLPYLPASLCERWDRVDGPICCGIGRYTLGQVYRYAMRALPRGVQNRVGGMWRDYFSRPFADDPSANPCAIAIEAFAD